MTERSAVDTALSRVSVLGWKVAGLLAVLTVIEYVIAVNVDSLVVVWLLPFIVAKGWLILDYFMHFRAFLRGEEH
jgi:uncharacterized membrane protein